MTEAWKDLVRILAEMTDLSEMEKLLREILTKKEISDLTLRWQLLKELHAGEPQRRIAARHGISLCKITRGSRILKAGDSVCANILKKEHEHIIPNPKEKNMTDELKGTALPDAKGYFGQYGGSYIPEDLQKMMDEVTEAYLEIRRDSEFHTELARLYTHYVGRPSPVFHAQNLSSELGGARIYLKREDLNHTGAHKINHCLGQALLAKKMGKKKIIAETGAGQHGVALATAAVLVGLECDIYMGEIDIVKEHPNVVRMKILGARVIPVSRGTKTLKDAVDACFEAYLADPVTQLYAIGSAVGPHPFPMMVRDFQSIVGREAREQFLEMTGKLPDNVVACVGGGSNSIGIFSGFLDDESVSLYGVEPGGRGPAPGDNAATMSLGTPGVLHGFYSYLLQDDKGNPLPVYSVASGLDYPGVGPQHSLLRDIKRAQYVMADDRECIDAFFRLARTEGIIPALESAHAVAFAIRYAPTLDPSQTILVNLSGRGDKDIDYVVGQYGAAYGV